MILHQEGSSGASNTESTRVTNLSSSAISIEETGSADTESLLGISASCSNEKPAISSDLAGLLASLNEGEAAIARGTSTSLAGSGCAAEVGAGTVGLRFATIETLS